jgi:hypothetical protein
MSREDAWMKEWSGDPDDLIGREDHLLVDAHLCDLTFASKHEAFFTGFSLGERSQKPEDRRDPGSDS